MVIGNQGERLVRWVSWGFLVPIVALAGAASIALGNPAPMLVPAGMIALWVVAAVIAYVPLGAWMLAAKLRQVLFNPKSKI